MDLEKSNNPTFVPKLAPQIIATVVACIAAFAWGTANGWSSPAIPSIRSEETFGILTANEESWIGSLLTLGAIFPGFVVGILLNKFGRKWTIFVLQIPFVGGWLLIVLAQNLYMVYAGRIITGFAGGAMTMVVPVYIAEIAESKIRGAMSALMVFFLVSGILFSYVIGAILSWVWLSTICGIMPIVSAISMLFMPDSPRFLLDVGRDDDARKSLVWLRGASSTEQIEPEVKEIQASIAESNQNSATIRDLFVPSNLKPVGISFTLMFLQQLGGINAVLFYASTIFESAGSDLDPNVSSIILGSVQVVVALITSFVVDKLGRKPLLVFSGTGMAICLIALGVFFYLKDQNNGVAPDGLGWLPLASLVLYIVTYSAGIGPLPWVLLGELVPNHIKGLAGGLGNSFCWGLAFIVTRTFADLNAAITAQGCYWLFGGVCIGGAIFSLLIVPETKGKSLDEINALFK